MPSIRFILSTASLLLLAACGSTPPPRAVAPAPVVASTARMAESNLSPASASLVSGRLALVPEAGGVHISGMIGGLQPLQQPAFHVHERGDCSAVDASSAGEYFNPTAQPHGRRGAGLPHPGDMPDLRADAQGRANVDIHLQGVTLGGGAANDIAGRALVVHARSSDPRRQAAGNAGVRIACGLIRVTR